MNWFILCCVVLWCVLLVNMNVSMREDERLHFMLSLKMFRMLSLDNVILSMVGKCNCQWFMLYMYLFVFLFVCVYVCVCVYIDLCVVQWNFVSTSGSSFYCKHIAFYSQIVWLLIFCLGCMKTYIQCFLCRLVCLLISVSRSKTTIKTIVIHNGEKDCTKQG